MKFNEPVPTQAEGESREAFYKRQGDWQNRKVQSMPFIFVIPSAPGWRAVVVDYSTMKAEFIPVVSWGFTEPCSGICSFFGFGGNADAPKPVGPDGKAICDIMDFIGPDETDEEYAARKHKETEEVAKRSRI